MSTVIVHTSESYEIEMSIRESPKGNFAVELRSRNKGAKKPDEWRRITQLNLTLAELYLLAWIANDSISQRTSS